MRSVCLHQRLLQDLITIGVGCTRPQQVNLAGLSQALAFCPNCHLATLALGLPFAGQREHLVQRLRRFLKTEQLHPLDCYGPLVKHLFRQWPDREVNLVMDRTDLEHRLSVLALGAAYQKRLVLLVWQVLAYGSSSADEQLALLRWVQPDLPAQRSVRIHFSGDCEFRAVAIPEFCQKAGWHWPVGLKSDLYVRRPDGSWHTLAALALQRGERRYLQAVSLNQQHLFGPVNVIADWAPHQDTPRYWALDLPAAAQAWRWGRKRYWIEPTLRLRSGQALPRLEKLRLRSGRE